MTLAGVAVIGTRALSFHPKKPSPHLVPQTTTYPRAKLATRDLCADHDETPPTPGTPTPTSRHTNGPKEWAITTAMSLTIETPMQSTYQSHRFDVRYLAPV
jgi:hypothetical protein